MFVIWNWVGLVFVTFRMSVFNSCKYSPNYIASFWWSWRNKVYTLLSSNDWLSLVCSTKQKLCFPPGSELVTTICNENHWKDLQTQKTYERANNVHVKCFLSRVKFGPNFTLFCRKSELCRDFAHLGVFFLALFGNWCYFLVFFCALFGSFGPFTLLCKFTFVAIYALFSGKIIYAQALLV